MVGGGLVAAQLCSGGHAALRGPVGPLSSAQLGSAPLCSAVRGERQRS